MYVVDLHCDTASLLYEKRTLLDKNTYHIDLQKLIQSGYVAQWFAYFVDIKNIGDKSPLQVVMEMDEYFKKQLSKHAEQIVLVKDHLDYCKAKKEGKVAAFLSVEEGAVIEEDLTNIDKLYNLGVRMMTLTWNYDNPLAFPHSKDLGLLPFGKQVVSYLNHMPMLLDVSHLSAKGVKESSLLYKKPIIASHCNAQGAYFHTRNLSDETIEIIAQSGGLIGINFYSYFLDGTRSSKIEAILRHIDYIYQKGGQDCISFGTDFDGIGEDTILEVCNAADMGKLIDRLSKKYSEELVEKFCYKNHERMLQEVF
jgi:membrane dipeptidase